MQLTEHFTLAEMIVSQAATRRGLDNNPDREQIAALTTLCEKVLEPIRAHFGRPVVVSSGYRSPLVNQKIGGSASSQHCKGEAADFTIPGIANIDVAQWAWRNLYYDQLIYEYGASGWLHISYREGRLRNQELSAVRRNGKTVYLPGIAP